MQRFFLSLAVAFCPALAMAGEVQPDAPSSLDWSGLYVGAHGGWSQIKNNPFSPAQLTAPAYDVDEIRGNSIVGGLRGGIDKRFGPFVLGLGVDMSFFGTKGDSIVKVDEILSVKPRVVGDISGRLGYLFQDNLLGYVKGGLAVGQFSYGSVDERWNLVDEQRDEVHFGSNVGAGFEFRLGPKWSVFAEYDYMTFKSKTVTFDYGPGVYPASWTYQFDHKLSLVTAGINLRF